MYGLEIRRQIRRRRGMLGYTIKDMAEGQGKAHKSYICMENGKRRRQRSYIAMFHVKQGVDDAKP